MDVDWSRQPTLGQCLAGRLSSCTKLLLKQAPLQRCLAGRLSVRALTTLRQCRVLAPPLESLPTCVKLRPAKERLSLTRNDSLSFAAPWFNTPAQGVPGREWLNKHHLGLVYQPGWKHTCKSDLHCVACVRTGLRCRYPAATLLTRPRLNLHERPLLRRGLELLSYCWSFPTTFH
eukprot:5410076-Amphidinium_carterae.3